MSRPVCQWRLGDAIGSVGRLAESRSLKLRAEPEYPHSEKITNESIVFFKPLHGGLHSFALQKASAGRVKLTQSEVTPAHGPGVGSRAPGCQLQANLRRGCAVQLREET